jgi:hypothetical protein
LDDFGAASLREASLAGERTADEADDPAVESPEDWLTAGLLVAVSFFPPAATGP